MYRYKAANFVLLVFSFSTIKMFRERFGLVYDAIKLEAIMVVLNFVVS